MNEGQRQRTGSLSLQVKSGASTVRAASSRTSSRHIYISYIEFIVLIHIINSYTKFIVLIHIIICNFFGQILTSRQDLAKVLEWVCLYIVWIHIMKYVHELITWWNSNMKLHCKLISWIHIYTAKIHTAKSIVQLLVPPSYLFKLCLQVKESSTAATGSSTVATGVHIMNSYM